MRICVVGVSEISLGKQNLKDPRLDQADRLIEAKKKVYAQVDAVGEEGLLDSDTILVHADRFPDLLLEDLGFIETRLTREPSHIERSAFDKLKKHLEDEGTVFSAALTRDEVTAIGSYNLVTKRPVVVARPGELEDPSGLVLRAFRESGYICFLTVGGKENRAWPVRKGTTAWEAAGCIHSDIQRGFIRAEVIGYDDFVQAGGETQAKRAGKQRLELRDYVIQDYDLVNFRFNK